MWELATGQLLQRAPITLNGEVMARSPDATRYLTQSFGDDVTIESVDVLGGESLGGEHLGQSEIARGLELSASLSPSLQPPKIDWWANI